MKCIVSILLSFSLILNSEFAGQKVLGEVTEQVQNDFSIRDGVLVSYQGNDVDIEVPEGVIEIGSDAFYMNQQIRTVKLPEGVTVIGSHAFDSCNLETIELPNSVTTIGENAFFYCTNLKSIELGDGVSSIGSGAFYGCSSLETIQLPDSISIAASAFGRTKWLEERKKENPFVCVNGMLLDGTACKGAVKVPDTVTRINDGAFAYTEQISSVEIPASVESIGRLAFTQSSVETVIMEDSVKIIEERAFERCYYLKDIRLSDSLKELGTAVFWNCNSLEKITIPDSLKRLDYSGLSQCRSLKYVTLPEHLSSFTEGGDFTEEGIFDKKRENSWKQNPYIFVLDKEGKNEILKAITEMGLTLRTLELEAESVALPLGETYKLRMNSQTEGCSWKSDDPFVAAVNSQGMVTAKKIGTTVITAILYGKELQCTVKVISSGEIEVKLTEEETKQKESDFEIENGILTLYKGREEKVEIPEGVSEIGQKAFFGNQWIHSVALPKGVTVIGESAFAGCRFLKTVLLPDSLTKIGESAFADCSSLEKVELPDNVAEISNEAFVNCKSLKEFYFGEAVSFIGKSAFDSCASLEKISFPENLTEIDSYAFSSCSSLKTIYFPEHMISIGAQVFEGTEWLAKRQKENSVVIVNRVVIDGTACEGAVEIPEGVKEIGASAFISNPLIRWITVPEGVTVIGDYAFDGCNNLETVKLPDSVTKIGDNAFFSCRKLKSIHLGTAVSSIGENAFRETKWLTEKRKETPLVIVNGMLIDGSTCKGTVVIPNTVTRILGGAFLFANITSVRIPASVKEIGDGAFELCRAVTITMADSVEIIGRNAFYRCHELKNIRLSKAIKRLEADTFYECNKLENITIPDSVEFIDDVGFLSCESLNYITVPNTLSNLAEISAEHQESGLWKQGPEIYVLNKEENTYIVTAAEKLGFTLRTLRLRTNEITLSPKAVYELRMNSYAKCDRWVSSNPSVATVNYYGRVTAKKKGSAIITAVLYGKKFRCKVTVK